MQEQTKSKVIDIYGGKDPRNIPNHHIEDVARYLNISTSKIKSWIKIYKTFYSVYPDERETERKFPLHVRLQQTEPIFLTFTNLIELHVLRGMKHPQNIFDEDGAHGISAALNYCVHAQFNQPHLLAHRLFYTDGLNLFLEGYTVLMCLSPTEKLSLEKHIKMYLNRIAFDENGMATKFYPFTHSNLENNPKIISIDPRMSFGRLVITNTGIPTDIIAERYLAGDSIEELVYDYDCEQYKIEEAIRYEMSRNSIA